MIAYSNPPVGAVTTIVPVGVPQTGCVVTEAVAAVGAPRAAVTVTVAPVAVQVLSEVDLTFNV